ncbi:MAG: HAD-IC family P-type ATPase, partial [Heliobacteriaceae bacterium]|nr:HAD-IC family P-type ATPase [Heliobacteriaceae bacterium]
TPRVTDFELAGSQPEAVVLGWVQAIENRSTHPLARALTDFTATRNVTPAAGSDFAALPGWGVTGTVAGRRLVIAAPKWFGEKALSPALQTKTDRLQAEGKTVMLLGDNADKPVIYALFAVADTMRRESPGVIAALKRLGLERTVLLTGDNRQTARTIARQTRVTTVHNDLLPEDKVAVIRQYTNQGKIVGMVGDGINDAPALAAAHVGIAMGGAGAGAAIESANIVLMSDDLTNLPRLVQLSRQARQIIRQNVWFALVVKVLALALIIPNWLTLWLAVLSDTGAAVLVTLNSLRLLRFPRSY